MAPAALRLAARVIRGARGGAGRRRPVRRDELLGQSTRTGNRIANGARGSKPRRFANGDRRRFQIDGSRAGTGAGVRNCAQPFYRQPAFRRDADRSADLRGSGDAVVDGGDVGLLRSGSQSRASGSDGSASARMKKERPLNVIVSTSAWNDCRGSAVDDERPKPFGDFGRGARIAKVYATGVDRAG